jgi:DNA-binding response OmpR family regulator
LSGNHFCALIKSLLTFRSTRVIILLQGDDDLARARALAAGADAVLIKPFGKEELLTLMVDRSSKAA